MKRMKMGALWTSISSPNPRFSCKKLVPLWENGFHNWARILGRAPDGRPYFLEERELIWANPSISFPLPNNLTHALKYIRVVLASTSFAHWQNIRKNITLPAWGVTPSPIEGAPSWKATGVHSPTNRPPKWWTTPPSNFLSGEPSCARQEPTHKVGPKDRQG